MNLYHVFSISFELYRLKFDIDEARVRAYRVADSFDHDQSRLYSRAWTAFKKNWKA